MSNPEPDAEQTQQIKHALRHYHDRAALGSSPLSVWHNVRRRLSTGHALTDALALGKAVQDLLSEAVEALKPNSPPSDTAREWRAYHLLDRTFRQGESARQVYESRLHISRAHYYRELDRAIAAAAALLHEWESSVGERSGLSQTTGPPGCRPLPTAAPWGRGPTRL